ncbi:MAG: hypothetical protein ABJF01_17130 [bacterium]
MSRRLAAVVAILTAFSLLACHHQSNEHAIPAAKFVGLFSYRIAIDSREERGTLTIGADTAIIAPENGYCRDAFEGRSGSYRWSCAGSGDFASIQIALDAHSSVPSGSWSATHTVTKQRTVCVTYTTNASGQRVCSQFETQNYDVPETKSGRLIMQAVGGT